MSELRAVPAPEEVSEPVNELFQDLPPLVARGLVYVLLGLLLGAGLYATIGKVDVIVSARGTTAPPGLTRPLQATMGGRVTRVAVQEGDHVEKGQVLLYLETAAAQAQLERAQQGQAIRQSQLRDAMAGQVDAPQIAEARARLAQAETEVAAANRTLEASMILAPMAGQVTQLTVHGAGEAVQPGQTVAAVAPTDSPLVVEAQVENNDVGRVRVGQSARIKVDAYPHQEYGALEGHVQSVSPDAVTQGQGPSRYRVVVVPTPRSPSSAPSDISLRLGLTATVEIVTERRRIIELFLRRVRGER